MLKDFTSETSIFVIMNLSIFKTNFLNSIQTQVTWQAPSNIALIKYWGKHGEQLPKNPSLSFTLSNCISTTALDIIPNSKGTDISFDFYFEGQSKPKFHSKIEVFFKRILPYCPWIANHHITINSQNSFPHSSGIASSASAMAALASCIVAAEELSDDYADQKASFLARLGSGSAARSINGPITVWGATEGVKESSDFFAVPLSESDYDPIFNTYCDTILLIDQGQKKISSTQGHQLMENHPFGVARFKQAFQNMEKLIKILEEGDLDAFISIVETEALTLHALMMTGSPNYILMHPNTMEVIQSVWNFRQETKLPVCFTLDAGANVHLLYPQKDAAQIEDWIDHKLKAFCQEGKIIKDKVGRGAKKV